MEIRVLVADSARARVFASHSAIHHLKEQEGFVQTLAHRPNRELVGDAAGRSVDQHGSLDPAISAKEHEARNFAKMLTRHLKDLHNQQHFENLVLIASPRFLGMLRAELPKPLQQIVTRTVAKDLTLSSVKDIIRNIED
jgi:protein required for attachment to host cells